MHSLPKQDEKCGHAVASWPTLYGLRHLPQKGCVQIVTRVQSIELIIKQEQNIKIKLATLDILTIQALQHPS